MCLFLDVCLTSAETSSGTAFHKSTVLVSEPRKPKSDVCTARRFNLNSRFLSYRSDFLATYWVPGAIGHSILRTENPILTESGCATAFSFFLSFVILLVLANEFIENSPFWKRIDCPISTPPPLENDPTSFSKNRRLVPGFSCSTG